MAAALASGGVLGAWKCTHALPANQLFGVHFRKVYVSVHEFGSASIAVCMVIAARQGPGRGGRAPYQHRCSRRPGLRVRV